MADTYDVVIIGSGPGGYVCAIKCGQLGLKTAIIEKSPTLGGTCLNVGCIPSKALLHASEMFAEAGHGMAALGITVGKPKLNLKAMMAHKDNTVKANVDGVAYLMKKNKVDVYHGTGSIAGKGKVTVTDDKGKKHTFYNFYELVEYIDSFTMSFLPDNFSYEIKINQQAGEQRG